MATTQAKCWYVDHWVQFTLTPGIYENIITFLESQELFFLGEMNLDFDIIPIDLHGWGRSQNLLDYLAKNTDNNDLILNFLLYFFNYICEFCYLDGTKIVFSLIGGPEWQGLGFKISGEIVIIYVSADSTYYSCDANVISCDNVS